jgi:hypothetical protein
VKEALKKRERSSRDDANARRMAADEAAAVVALRTEVGRSALTTACRALRFTVRSASAAGCVGVRSY